MPKKDDKEITVEAEMMVSTTFRNTCRPGEHVMRRFDRAWAFAMERAMRELPVKIELRGFVRKED